MERFRALEIKKIISEYSFLLDEEEWKNEIIDKNKIEFLNKINEKKGKEEDKCQDEKKSDETNKNNALEKFEISENTKKKIRKIYYKIANITHPDKITDDHLNAIYQESTKFYDQNNILEIYRIANSLKIEFEIDEEEIKNFSEIIEYKRKKLKSIESSWLWVWINCKNDEEKEKIVELFLKEINENKNG